MNDLLLYVLIALVAVLVVLVAFILLKRRRLKKAGGGAVQAAGAKPASLPEKATAGVPDVEKESVQKMPASYAQGPGTGPNDAESIKSAIVSFRGSAQERRPEPEKGPEKQDEEFDEAVEEDYEEREEEEKKKGKMPEGDEFVVVTGGKRRAEPWKPKADEKAPPERPVKDLFYHEEEEPEEDREREMDRIRKEARDVPDIEEPISSDDTWVVGEDLEEIDGEKLREAKEPGQRPLRKFAEPEEEEESVFGPITKQKSGRQKPDEGFEETRESRAPKAADSKATKISDIVSDPESFTSDISVEGNLRLSSAGKDDFWYVIYDGTGSAVARSSDKIPHDRCRLTVTVEKTRIGQTFLQVKGYKKA